MEDRIIDMAHKTWNAIGADILTAVEEGTGDTSIPRDEVVEVVMDADHMNMYGHDPEAYKYFQTLDYDDKERVLKKAFPLSRYGW